MPIENERPLVARRCFQHIEAGQRASGQLDGRTGKPEAGSSWRRVASSCALHAARCANRRPAKRLACLRHQSFETLAGASFRCAIRVVFLLRAPLIFAPLSTFSASKTNCSLVQLLAKGRSTSCATPEQMLRHKLIIRPIPSSALCSLLQNSFRLREATQRNATQCNSKAHFFVDKIYSSAH